MTQGRVEGEPTPSAGTSLLEAPFEFLRWLRDLRNLEKPLDPDSGVSGLDDRGKSVALESYEALRRGVQANFVKWLQDQWQEVDGKISPIPFAGLVLARSMQVGTTLITEEEQKKGLRTVMLRWQGTNGEVLTSHFRAGNESDSEPGPKFFKMQGSYGGMRYSIDIFLETGTVRVDGEKTEGYDFSFDRQVAQLVEATP